VSNVSDSNVSDHTGTDHPFFPPLDCKEKEVWPSVATNFEAIKDAFDTDVKDVAAVLGGNATCILNIPH